MPNRTPRQKAVAAAFNVVLLLVALLVWRTTIAAVENTSESAESSNTAAVYAAVVVCDNQLQALDRAIDTRTWVAVTRALSAPLTNADGTDAGGQRTALLERAAELSLIRQDVATYRFDIARDTLAAIAEENLTEYTCPKVPQVFIEAANAY